MKKPPSYLNIVTLRLAAAIFTLLSTGVALRAAEEKPGPVAYVTVETAEMRVEFAGERAWTFSGIWHQGEVITDRHGFCGTVFSPEGGRWIGTGHNEGGIEKIEHVAMTMDGKPCELKDQAVYRGQRAELHKVSAIGPIKLQVAYIVTDNAVLERHRYQVTKEVQIGSMYGFMHPFLPSTTEWLAEKADGTMVEAAFQSDGGHALIADVQWAAVFDPTTKQISLVWYPKPLIGQGLKTFFWEKTIYHKLYNQLYAHATLPAGTEFEAVAILRCAPAEAPSWKDKARALAKETRAQFEKGELGF
jgi:hypothetical protein